MSSGILKEGTGTADAAAKATGRGLVITYDEISNKIDHRCNSIVLDKMVAKYDRFFHALNKDDDVNMYALKINPDTLKRINKQ